MRTGQIINFTHKPTLALSTGDLLAISYLNDSKHTWLPCTQRNLRSVCDLLLVIWTLACAHTQ